MCSSRASIFSKDMENTIQSQDDSSPIEGAQPLAMSIFSLLVQAKAYGLRSKFDPATKFLNDRKPAVLESWEVAHQLLMLGALKATRIVEKCDLNGGYRLVLGRVENAESKKTEAYRVSLYSGVRRIFEQNVDYAIVVEAFRMRFSGLCAVLAFDKELAKRILNLLPGSEPEALIEKINLGEILPSEEADALIDDIEKGERRLSKRL